MTHTTDGSTTDGEHYLSHTLPWLFFQQSQKYFSPRNAERQMTSNQSHPSLVTVCTSQATEQHRTRRAGLHSMNHKAACERWTRVYISL